MSDFSFEIAADPRSANAAIAGVERGLAAIEAHALQTARVLTQALGRGATAARDAEGRFQLLGRTGASGGGATASAMDRASARVRSLTGDVSGLTTAMQSMATAVAAVYSAHKLGELVDGYTQVSNRLGTVADSQANVNGLLEESHKIAQQTYTDWTVTAEAVVRFTNATKELGLSQREVLDFTTSLNKAIILSGASTAEATNGLIQLSQGLASGALRGDELRSVLENLPTVAGIIAKGMGKTIGELRKLGAEGKITAEAVYNAFQKAAPDIEAKFGKVVPTIAQNFTMLKNEAVKFFGEMATGSGLLRGIGDAFRFVIDHFDTFGRVLLGVGEALIGLYVLEKIILLVRALTVAIAANPLGALLVALVAGVALLRQFGDQIDAGLGPLTKVSDVLGVLWEDVKALGSAIIDFVGSAWSALTDAFDTGLPSDGIEFSLTNALMLVASFVDAAIAIFTALKKTILTVFGGIPVVLGEIFVDIARGVSKLFEEMINTLIRGVNALLGSINVEKIRKQFQEGQAKGLTGDALKAYAFKGARNNVFDEVDFSFDNPLAGATDTARQQFMDAWGKDFGSEVARDWVKGWTDGIKERANAAAENRHMKDQIATGFGWLDPGTIGTDGGPASPRPPTKEEESAAKKLAKELASITSASSPMVDAQMKLAKAIDVTDRAMRAGLITFEQAERIVADTAAKTDEARAPFLAWLTAITAETNALRMSNNEREQANAVREAENRLREQGVEITDRHTAMIERHVAALRGEQAAQAALAKRQTDLQAALTKIRGPLDDYNYQLDLHKELLRDGAITQDEYTRAVDGLKTSLSEANRGHRTFDEQVMDGLRAMRDEAVDVAGQIKGALTAAFGAVEDAIVDLVTKGEMDWRRMVSSMLSELTRLILRQSLALALPGHATGATWTIGGAGGTDSQLVAFRGTPGEQVTVRNPAQSAQDDRARQWTPAAASGGVRIVNNWDPNGALAAVDSPGGERLIMNTVMRNMDLIRAHLSRR